MEYADSEYQADCCCTYEYAAGEIYEYVFALLGAIGFAGIVMFISAAVKIMYLPYCLVWLLYMDQ